MQVKGVPQCVPQHVAGLSGPACGVTLVVLLTHSARDSQPCVSFQLFGAAGSGSWTQRSHGVNWLFSFNEMEGSLTRWPAFLSLCQRHGRRGRWMPAGWSMPPTATGCLRPAHQHGQGASRSTSGALSNFIKQHVPNQLLARKAQQAC